MTEEQKIKNRARAKAWREKNKEKSRATIRKWMADPENLERKRQLDREYTERNRERKNAYRREWTKKNRKHSNEYHRKRYASQKDRYKNYRLFTKYGITLEEFNEMVRQQEGKCKIHRAVPEDGKLVVDHKHWSGYENLPPEEKKKYIRGLLCDPCNQAIGLLQDSPTRMLWAHEYLFSLSERMGIL